MRDHIRHQSGVPFEIIHKGDQHRFVLKNVSLGGVACYGTVEIPVQSQVEVRITLLKPPYCSHGQVIWCKPGDQGYELGIELSGEKDKARLRMVEDISHIEHYRNEILITEQRQIDIEQAAREWVATHYWDYD
jgi:hypothetical protein